MATILWKCAVMMLMAAAATGCQANLPDSPATAPPDPGWTATAPALIQPEPTGAPESTGSPAISIDPLALAALSPESARQVILVATLEGHTNYVTDLAFSPDGKYLASASRDNTLRVWEAKTGREVQQTPARETDLNAIAFSLDGKLLASAQGVWDVQSMEKLSRFAPTLNSPGHIAFSPDGLYLAASLFGQAIKLVETASGEMVRSFKKPGEGYENDLFGIVFSPDGKLLAGSGHNGKVRVWDTESGALVDTYTFGYQGDIHDLALSSDGAVLALVGTDEMVGLMDFATGKMIHSMGARNGLYGVAISPDDALVATAGCDRTVRLWEVESGELLKTLAHGDEVMAVAISPDGKLIASGGYDNVIRL